MFYVDTSYLSILVWFFAFSGVVAWAVIVAMVVMIWTQTR